MPRDDYGIYRKPTASVIAAWLGVAAAIFFGAYSVKVKDRLQKALTGAQEVREEADQLKLTMLRQQGEIQSLRSELESVRAVVQPAAAKTTDSPAVRENPAPVTITPIASAPATIAAAPVPVVAKAPVPPVAAVTPAKVELSAQPVMPAAVIRAEENVSLPGAALRTADGTASKAELAEAARLAGEILTFNPDTRKVYLSLGSANGGLQPGNRFSVWRGEKYVTDIRVVKVFSVTSTCEVDGPTPIGIRAGDIARLAARPGNAL